MQGMSEEETKLTANFLRKNLLPTTTKKLKLKDNERAFGTKIVKNLLNVILSNVIHLILK
jgi:uncharacterized protein YaaW (UPF0174 family)